MISSNKKVQSLLEICKKHDVKDIVFSAGSRNAPLVISFNEDDYFTTSSLVDERSAGFFALGIAQQTQTPVVLSCTSGSAVLNYAPAIAEAYYQNIPLIIITADRPPEWIDHGEGQSIRQNSVFQNYIQASFSIPIGMEDNDLWYSNRIVNEAINCSKTFSKPVHINLPFREPLYEKIENPNDNYQVFSFTKSTKQIDEEELNILSKTWNGYDKILILCGLMPKNEKLNYLLSEINKSGAVAILTETTANLSDNQFIPCIDRTLAKVDHSNIDFIPELVITIGGAIISKKIKSYLRQINNLIHWHVGSEPDISDTFQALSLKIDSNPFNFFKAIAPKINFEKNSQFKSKWLQAHLTTQNNHLNFIKECDWSDLKATGIIHDFLPDNSNLHLSNSSPVRYFQLFDQINTVQYNSNRGVSGIDGCTSTASGAAYINNKQTILITGDLGFVYDINALWNKNLPSNLRIIVINNSGGGIFRIIPGPDTTNQLEDFFEVGNPANIELLAKAYQLSYYQAKSETELENILPEFFLEEVKTARVLEIFTPREQNPKVLKEYFEYLGK